MCVCVCVYISARKGIFLLQYLIKLDSVATRRHTHTHFQPCSWTCWGPKRQNYWCDQWLYDRQVFHCWYMQRLRPYTGTHPRTKFDKKLKITSHNTRYNLCHFSVTLPRDICTNCPSTFSKWLISHTLTVLMTLFFQRSHEEYSNRQHTHILSKIV